MELSSKVQEKEEILMGYLSPIESSVMTFQNVLVWDNPQHSVILFIVVHILFWLATSVRIYYVIGLTGTIIVAVDMWKNHIWPEIRVQPAPGEDDEEWTPVHPRLLSVPEICHWLAQWWVYLSDMVDAAFALRKQNHPKFFFNAVFSLSCLAVLGCYIPGILIAYLSVLFCLLWPCVLYHDGLTKMQEYLQPVITSMEEKINIKRKRKGKRRSKRRRGDKPKLDTQDSDSEELQEFLPKIAEPKQVLTESLEQSDSDDEEGFKSGLQIPPAVPSRTPSREHSDVEDVMGASTDELHSLISGLKDIPSHTDSLDGNDNNDDRTELSTAETYELEQAVEEAITEDQAQTTQEVAATVPSNDDMDPESIQFISSHFSQFSDGEDDKDDVEHKEPDEEIITEMTKDIPPFPDIEDSSSSEQPTAAQAMMASGLQLLTNQGQSLMSQGQALVSALGSTDVSSLVTSAMFGLNTIRDTVSSVVQQSQQGHADKTDNQTSESNSSGRQIDAEFEFLNEADLDQAVLENFGDGDK